MKLFFSSIVLIMLFSLSSFGQSTIKMNAKGPDGVKITDTFRVEADSHFSYFEFVAFDLKGLNKAGGFIIVFTKNGEGKLFVSIGAFSRKDITALRSKKFVLEKKDWLSLPLEPVSLNYLSPNYVVSHSFDCTCGGTFYFDFSQVPNSN